MQHAMFSKAVPSKLENYIYADSVFTVNPFSAFQFLLPLQMYFSNPGKARQNYSLQVAAPGWLSNVLYY